MNKTTYTKKTFLCLFLKSLMAWPNTGLAQQQTYLGDMIFEIYKHQDSLVKDSFYTHVEIGKLFDHDRKHALIFQQVDSIEYINQLKLISYSDNETIEKIIDTFEIGMFIDFRRIDMNHDGYKDVLITQGSQRSWDRLYLFDPESDSLISIPEFSGYRSTNQVRETEYFYSYTSKGCADDLWESKLIRFEGNNIQEHGTIYGDGCHQESKLRVIRITHEDEDKSLPMDQTIMAGTSKWEFIKSYWEQFITNK